MARKSEVKKIRIDIRGRSGAKKLAKLLDDGWEIQAQQKRGALQLFPGETDFVLTRAKSETTRNPQSEPETPPTPLDEHEATSTPKWLTNGGTNPVKTPQPAHNPNRTVQSGTVPEKYRSESSSPQSSEQTNIWWGIGGIAVIAAVILWVVFGLLGKKDETPRVAPESVTQTQAPKPMPTTVEPPAPAENEPTEATPAAPEPAPVPVKDRDATDAGLTFGMASVACDNAGKAAFPYGWDAHWIVGLIGEEVTADNYFLKASVDVKNEFDAKTELVVECTVTGDEYAPEVTAFDVY